MRCWGRCRGRWQSFKMVALILMEPHFQHAHSLTRHLAGFMPETYFET